MNILVLNWRDIRHPRAGGAEVRLHEVYRRLVAQGHRVVLVCSRWPGSAECDEVDGIRVRRMGSDVTHLAMVWCRLRTLLREECIDVVVEDLNKLPYFAHLVHNKPSFVQMHHLWLSSIFRESNFLAACVVWASERLIPVFYRRQPFLVVSPSTAKELAGLGIPPAQIGVVYNGTRLDVFTPDPGVVREKSVLWIGRLQKYKGILDALRAFERFVVDHPEYTLLIAGDGPFRTEVERVVAESDILSSRVHLLGFVSAEEKLRLYRSCQFMVQTSYKEGWGLTVLEANACGMPVIANMAPGLVDSVCDGKTGLLYPFASVDGLVAHMDLLASDAGVRDQLSRNALEWSRRFTWDVAAEQTMTALERIVRLV